jgi:hypothetical protein
MSAERALLNRLSGEHRRDLAALRERGHALDALESADSGTRDRVVETQIVAHWLSLRDARRARLAEPVLLGWLDLWHESAAGNLYVKVDDALYAATYPNACGTWSLIARDEITREVRRCRFRTRLAAQRRAFDLTRSLDFYLWLPNKCSVYGSSDGTNRIR